MRTRIEYIRLGYSFALEARILGQNAVEVTRSCLGAAGPCDNLQRLSLEEWDAATEKTLTPTKEP